VRHQLSKMVFTVMPCKRNMQDEVATIQKIDTDYYRD